MKAFDAARLGAAGLYVDAPLFADHVQPGVDGLLLPMEPQALADALVALASDSGPATSPGSGRARAAGGAAGGALAAAAMNLLHRLFGPKGRPLLPASIFEAPSPEAYAAWRAKVGPLPLRARDRR